MKRFWCRAGVLTLLTEGLSLLLRFGLEVQATRDTAWLAPYTFGLRIHHSYIGVLVGLVGLWLLKVGKRPGVGEWTAAVGVALVVSDLFHHFVVLWIAVGNPAFHLTYGAGG